MKETDEQLEREVPKWVQLVLKISRNKKRHRTS